MKQVKVGNSGSHVGLRDERTDVKSQGALELIPKDALIELIVADDLTAPGDLAAMLANGVQVRIRPEGSMLSARCFKYMGNRVSRNRRATKVYP